jgi:hypothetical protein
MIQWTEYTATIRFRDRLVGGIPVIPEGTDRADAYEGWARGAGIDPEDAADLATKLAADPDMPVTVEDVEGLATGFRSDDNGIYIEARQIKAMVREASQRLGIIKQVRGSRQVIQHDLHVRSATDPNGQKIYLDRMVADGTETRPISVITRQGPRTAIKRFDYVDQPEITFTIRVLAGGVGNGLIPIERIADIMELGCELGIGADRSQGEGTFDVVSLVENTTG